LSYSSTSKASPNDTGIVIIIIIIGKVEIVGFEHRGEIIAQSFFLFFFSVFLCKEWAPLGLADKSDFLEVFFIGQMWDINMRAVQSKCKV